MSPRQYAMRSAWIITREGTRHPTEVVGIISARKGAKIIKEYLEWLYALLHYCPQEHLDLAKYNNPSNPYRAEYWATNTGVPVSSMMTCGHNPYLVARLARNIVLNDLGKAPVLEWVNPDRIVCDSRTRQVIKKIPGKAIKAIVRLPLQVAKNFPDFI